MNGAIKCNRDDFVNTIISGSQFNKIYQKTHFIRLLTSFDQKLKIRSGKFYGYKSQEFVFLDIDNAYQWIYYDNELMKNMRSVVIPDTATVYVSNQLFSTNQIIFGKEENVPKCVYEKAIRYKMIKL